MAIYNLGSVNWDHVYRVAHFVRPGETLSSNEYLLTLGGKGANQSVAAARAGAVVMHIGAVNQSDEKAMHILQQARVNTDGIAKLETATGHAIIQVDPQGENAIVIYAGANASIPQEWIHTQLASSGPRDWLLLQNETQTVEYACLAAHQKSMKIAFNPAPMDKALTKKLLPYLDLLIVNQIELEDLTSESDYRLSLDMLLQAHSDLAIVVTLGAKGSIYRKGETTITQDSYPVSCTDSTGAGDTYIGYLLANLDRDYSIEEAMKSASVASALCVTQPGAIQAIPDKSEVEALL